MRTTKKTVKAWAWFSDTAFKPMKVDFGVMYATKREANEGLAKGDYVIPCTITYSLPTKKL